MKLAAGCQTPAAPPLYSLSGFHYGEGETQKEWVKKKKTPVRKIFLQTSPKVNNRVSVHSLSVHSTWGFSHCPSALQRTTGGWRCVNPGLHWYRMMEWTGYSSLLLPNMWAFSTSGGAPQDTEDTNRGHGASYHTMCPLTCVFCIEYYKYSREYCSN